MQRFTLSEAADEIKRLRRLVKQYKGDLKKAEDDLQTSQTQIGRLEAENVEAQKRVQMKEEDAARLSREIDELNKGLDVRPTTPKKEEEEEEEEGNDTTQLVLVSLSCSSFHLSFLVLLPWRERRKRRRKHLLVCVWCIAGFEYKELWVRRSEGLCCLPCPPGSSSDGVEKMFPLLCFGFFSFSFLFVFSLSCSVFVCEVLHRVFCGVCPSREK